MFALDIPATHPMFDQARLERGKALLQLGEHARAATDLEQARKRFELSHALVPETEALLALAAAAESDGKLTDALRLLNQATARIEQVRERAVNPHLRASYLASQARAFEARTALLMKLAGRAPTEAERSAQVVAALLSADRVRARTLRDARAGETRPRGYRSDASNPRATVLLDQIAVRHLQVDRLREREGTDPKILRAQEDQLQLMHAELDLLQSDQRLPPLESPLDAGALQRLQRRLPTTTAIVVYALGENDGWAWIVLRDTVEVVRVPPRREVDRLAHAFHTDESAYLRSGTASRRSGAGLSRAVIEPLLPHLSSKSPARAGRSVALRSVRSPAIDASRRRQGQIPGGEV